MLKGFPVSIRNLNSKVKVFLTVLSFGLMSSSLAEETNRTIKKEVIHIDAIDWCPQICLDSSRPGYVIELVKKIFENTQYQLSIHIYPWSRAIKNVTSGKADALLSPAKSEAPNLLYPKLPVGYQQMCFFTLKNSNWHYDGISSLKGLRIGIAADTSIEELNRYVESHPWQFQFQPYHERYLAQSIAKLEKDRMDSFLFTKNSTLFALRELRKLDEIKVVGCVSKAPIYMAFTPVASKQEKTSVMMSVFDSKLSAINETHYIKKLMASYHLPTESKS
ncbi:MAG: transporter substrate-binding domain-containing protein [Colwellia sp.]|nr:transporter substrate-binding domain-containing protein [Colwellia sp.]